MKTFDILVSKKFTFFVLKHVKYVYKDDVLKKKKKKLKIMTFTIND